MLTLQARCLAKTCCAVRVLAIPSDQPCYGPMRMQCLALCRQLLEWELHGWLQMSELSWVGHAECLSVHLLHCHVLDVHLEPSMAVPSGQIS